MIYNSQLDSMNKTYLYLSILIVLASIAYYSYIHQNNSTISNSESDFAVKQVDKIHKVFIANKNNIQATVTRNTDGRTWTYWTKNKQPYKVRPAAIQLLLETLQNVQVRYVVSEAGLKQAVNNLEIQGKKVELYDKKGKNFKTFYVGGATNDLEGTFMIMENSEQPYVVDMGTLTGTLYDRFLILEEDWRDKTVFAYKAADIKAIAVEYPKQREKSFRLERLQGNQFTVVPFYATTPAINYAPFMPKIEAYLYNFEKRIAEAFETKNPDRQTIISRVPFCNITVTNKKGIQQNVSFIPVITPVETNKEGYRHRQKVQRFFASINDNQDFMLVQSLVFNPVFWEYKLFFEQ